MNPALLSLIAGPCLVLSLTPEQHPARASSHHAVRILELPASFQWQGHSVSKKAIPLGDGKVSTSPKRGYVDSCTTHFGNPGGNGTTPWINAAKKTWNFNSKPQVEGNVSWPNATHSFTIDGSNRVLSSNDLPQGVSTGTFPIQSSDPAYQYDRNPNAIQTQSIRWTVVASPQKASSAECVGLGPIGMTADGSVFFNALDAGGRDAVAHELQDKCGGHPQQQGVYHYHTILACLWQGLKKSQSVLVGYALDGYGLYVERDSKGHLPTNKDLDACHGRTSKVLWDGKQTKIYHYDVTLEYPYTVGCFHGVEIPAPPN